MEINGKFTRIFLKNMVFFNNSCKSTMIFANGIYIKFLNIYISKNNVQNVLGESAIQITNFYFIIFDNMTISQCFSSITAAGVKVINNYEGENEGKV